MAWVDARALAVVGLSLLLGCPDDATSSDTESTSGTSSGGGSDQALTTEPVPGSTSSGSGAVDTTAAVDADSDPTTTPGTSTGEPTGEGRMRLVVGAGGELGAGFEELSIVEYDQGVVSQNPIHAPLRDGRLIGNWGVSPAGTALTYRTAAAKGSDDRAFVAQYADGTAEDPARFNVAPAPDPGVGGNPAFTDDNATIVFFSLDAAGENPQIWAVDNSGPTPEAPVLIHPALSAGDDVNFDLAVGPGDAGIAFTGDLTGGGLNNLYLAPSDPATTGTATLLSEHDDPAQAVAFSSIAWVPDGSGIVYRADADTDELDELWWVGLPDDTPTAPLKINAPLADGEGLLAVRLSPDSRAVAYWAGDGSFGEIYLSYVDGAAPTVAVPISTLSPNAATAVALRWARSGDALIYTAQHDTPGNRDAYYVDTSGAMPGMPARINGDLLPDSDVIAVVFGPAEEFVYYVAPQNQAGAELFRAPIVAGVPGIPERLSGTLTENGTLSGEIRFSDDGTELLYTATQDSPSRQELYLIELGERPTEPVKINDELEGDFEVQFAAQFSSDSTVIAYRVREGNMGPVSLLLEDRTDGLGNPVTVTDAAQGFAVLSTED